MEAAETGSGAYAQYEALRARGPVVWADGWFGGAWLVTGFDGVEAALKDGRLSAQRTGGWVMRNALRGSAERRSLVRMQRLLARALLFVDRPAHPRLRQAMLAGFRPAVVQGLRPFVQARVDELLAAADRALAAGRPFDAIESFAKPLPALVVSQLLGLRDVEPSEFLEWSTRIAAFLGAVQPAPAQVAAACEAVVAMARYLDGQIASGRCGDGLIANLVEAQRRGVLHDGTEMLAQCVMLLFAGHETTRHFLATALYWAVRRGDVWDALADPARAPAALRELMRWDSPVQYTGRRANTAFDLLGQPVRRGDLVIPLIGSANRDPRQYAAPDAIDVGRQAGLPLSFGAGLHFCLGAGLTLMEAECALGAVVRHWPRGALAVAEAAWMEGVPLYRGLRSLKLRRLEQ
ncbi:cytochrome P450 [Xylophilus sp.]|uniref:cytochrome P450 n=1 Tax=Xylophilus sp. TaxID=2653893 RepID=UPI0013B8597A|nr:cytochrome P450 [Xylophilus sp.]KAF1048547.1 MAG: Cytochrome P450 107B1 [Xylophilus sp.]